MSDRIREELSRIDPVHQGVAVPKATDESSRALLEEIMEVETKERPAATGRRGWVIAIAAASLLVVGIGAASLLGGDDGEPVAQPPPLELNAGSGGNLSLGSCIAFSVEELANTETGFEGTVTSVEGDRVVLKVDHWYKGGGDAEEVVIIAPQGLESLIAGFPLEVGQQYLITTSGIDIKYCGFSGPSTPEFRAAFEEAFPA